MSVVVVNGPSQPVPVTGSFSGPIAVSNFPTTQPVSGTVSVANFPSSQPVTVTSGAINVSNLPVTQPVSGSLAVTNFPSTQPVSGTVTVQNTDALPLFVSSVDYGLPGGQAYALTSLTTTTTLSSTATPIVSTQTGVQLLNTGTYKVHFDVIVDFTTTSTTIFGFVLAYSGSAPSITSTASSLKSENLVSINTNVSGLCSFTSGGYGTACTSTDSLLYITYSNYVTLYVAISLPTIAVASTIRVCASFLRVG